MRIDELSSPSRERVDRERAAEARNEDVPGMTGRSFYMTDPLERAVPLTLTFPSAL